MLEAVISLLIWVVIFAIVIYLVVWVLQTVVGIALPGKVIQLLWVLFALIVILMLVQIVLGGGGLPRLLR